MHDLLKRCPNIWCLKYVLSQLRIGNDSDFCFVVVIAVKEELQYMVFTN